MIGAVLAAAIVIATAPSVPTLATTARVPVSCVDNASWTTDFPSSVGSAMGVYDTRGHAIYLRTIICDRLAVLASGAESTNIRRQYDFASAVFLFAHETMHSRGIQSESQADCAAGRDFLHIATAIGTTPGYARVLADYLVNAHIPTSCYPNET
jgi:hypothetical protein